MSYDPWELRNALRRDMEYTNIECILLGILLMCIPYYVLKDAMIEAVTSLIASMVVLYALYLHARRTDRDLDRLDDGEGRGFLRKKREEEGSMW